MNIVARRAPNAADILVSRKSLNSVLPVMSRQQVYSILEGSIDPIGQLQRILINIFQPIEKYTLNLIAHHNTTQRRLTVSSQSGN